MIFPQVHQNTFIDWYNYFNEFFIRIGNSNKLFKALCLLMLNNYQSSNSCLLPRNYLCLTVKIPSKLLMVDFQRNEMTSIQQVKSSFN
jgi:hypothetical protein